MEWSKSIRQTHRVLSIVFTVLVLVNIGLNFLPASLEQLALWVGIATLLPLALLMATGLYMFALPYMARRREARPRAARPRAG